MVFSLENTNNVLLSLFWIYVHISKPGWLLYTLHFIKLKQSQADYTRRDVDRS